jgi:hypothetical protein
MFGAGLAAVVALGTSPARADAESKIKGAYQDSKDAVSHAWDKVKSATFEKRDDFTANAKALSSRLDAQMSELKADAADAKASASRKAAYQEFKDSDVEFKDKVKALGHASADTWDSAKENVIAAWDRAQAAYYRARAK